MDTSEPRATFVKPVILDRITILSNSRTRKQFLVSSLRAGIGQCWGGLAVTLLSGLLVLVETTTGITRTREESLFWWSDVRGSHGAVCRFGESVRQNPARICRDPLFGVRAAKASGDPRDLCWSGLKFGIFQPSEPLWPLLARPSLSGVSAHRSPQAQRRILAVEQSELLERRGGRCPDRP